MSPGKFEQRLREQILSKTSPSFQRKIKHPQKTMTGQVIKWSLCLGISVIGVSRKFAGREIDCQVSHPMNVGLAEF